jgi:hypothetical protein
VNVAGNVQRARTVRAGTQEFVRLFRIAMRTPGMNRVIPQTQAWMAGFEATAKAARIGRVASRASIALTVVTSAIDIALMIRDRKVDSRREQEFAATAQALGAQVDTWATAMTDADESLAELRAEAAALDEAVDEAEDRLRRLEAEVAAAQDRLAVYEHAAELGRTALTAPALVLR